MTEAVPKLKVSMLWATFATLFCSKYFRELTISSSGHVKNAPNFLAHLNKYPLIYECLKGQICPFPNRALFFSVGISESQRFWTACCRCWSFGVDSFFVLFIRSGEFKVCVKIIFWWTLMVARGRGRAANTAFSIFLFPKCTFFWWMFSFSCELFREFRKNNQIEFLRSLRGEKSSFLELLLKKEKKRRGIPTFWVPFSDDLDPNF